MGEAVSAIAAWADGHDAFARWLNRFYELVEPEARDIAAIFGGRVSKGSART